MKKMFFKTITAIVLVLGFSVVAFAQTPLRKWGVGASFGARDTKTDVGNEIFLKGWDNPYVVWGVYLSKYLNPSFDASLNLNGGMMAFKGTESQYGRFTAKAVDFSLMGKYKFNNGYILKENAVVAPYLTAGLGLYQAWDIINKDYVPVKEVDHMTVFDIPFGAGIRFNVSEKVNFNVQSIYHLGFTDELDNIVTGGNDAWLHSSVGVGFNLGKSSIKDEDSDGVSDDLDKCPGTRPSFKVDMFGCDADTDKDGVADTEDNCPDKAGSAKLYGCPDTDKDGVADNTDRCPDVAGLPAFDGCPDADGDGIKDAEDQCPQVAGIAQFAGCPDTDGDGLKDSEDKCPTAAGKVEFGGCPDTDGDGLNDSEDKCPTLAGTVEDGGCPKVNQAVKKQIEQAASQIYFETGKDVLKKESNVGLDKVVALLDSDKDLKVDIEGHTDNVGDAVKNKELSDKRAAAVKNYLTAKGIDASRITSVGYGSEKPVADNKTAAGKAKNRRVELKLKY